MNGIIYQVGEIVVGIALFCLLFVLAEYFIKPFLGMLFAYITSPFEKAYKKIMALYFSGDGVIVPFGVDDSELTKKQLEKKRAAQESFIAILEKSKNSSDSMKNK